MNFRRAIKLISSALILTAASTTMAADSYPSRAINLIVPFPPGGATDNVGRVFADHLQKTIGQSVIVANRPGANARIGTQAVARSPADGYTLLLGGIGPFTIAPHIEKVAYDPFGDFEPISLLVTNDVVLIASPELPVDDVRSLIDYVKVNPGTVNFGSSGPGGPFHLSGELFNSLAGLDMMHVPYKGDAYAIVDLMAGEIQVMFTTISAAQTQIEAGQVKVLASAGTTRSQLLPDIPTVAESGVPEFSSVTWIGLFAPSGTPKEAISALQDAVKKTMQLPALQEAMIKQGNSIVGSDSEYLAKFVKTESDKWGEVVRRAGIK